MSEQNTNTWPFSEIPDADDLDISAIFGGSGTATNDNDKNLFETPAPSAPAGAAPVTPQMPPAATVPPAATAQPAAPATPVASPAGTAAPTAPPAPAQPAAAAPPAQPAAATADNPIAAAFEKKTVENAQKSLLEKAPVFCHIRE